MNIFILIAIIYTNAEQLNKIHEEVKESFQEKNGWTIQNGVVQQQFCNSKIIFGGFDDQTIISKLLILPQHFIIKISVDIWSSEQGLVKIYLDHNEISTLQEQQICSENKHYLRTFTSEIKHNGASVIIVMSGNGEKSENKWGFRNLEISIQKCSSQCQDCGRIPLQDDCDHWIMFQNSWTGTHTNFMGQDGWISINGIGGSTNCGGVPLIGGYQKFGQNQGLSKRIKLKPHYQIRLLVLWAKIDSWDNENGLILFDGKQVWNQSYNNDNGYRIKLCGNMESKYHTLFQRVDIIVDHTGDYVKIDFLSSLDQGSDDESFGLRDLQLFYASCSDQCDICKGPFVYDCIKCSNYQFTNEKGCYPQQNYQQQKSNFYILQSNFENDIFTNAEGWILKEKQYDLIITECQEKTILGGYGVLGVGGEAEKQFYIPPHNKLRLQITLYKIDSWDGEIIIIEIDDEIKWDSSSYQGNEGNLCGSDFPDKLIYVDQIFIHQQQDTIIRIRSTLDENSENESWGFRDFSLMYDNSNIIEIADAFEYLVSLGIIIIFICFI